MTPSPEEIRAGELAAGELEGEAAAEARAALGGSPRLAALYGRIREAHRALSAFRRSAGDPPDGFRERVLGNTLPVFRSLYGRRSLLPTWLTAAAAAAVLLIVQPPPFGSAFESLDGISRRASSFLSEAGDRADRVLTEWSVIRASMGTALEDGADEVGERLQELEEVARHRNRIRDREEAAP